MIWPWLISGLAVGAGYFSARHAWWRRTVPWHRPRVLMYHMITPPRPGARFNGMRVSPGMFERQLAWLRARGFTFDSMRDLAAKHPGPRSVVLTFDDGYRDNLLGALPLLQKHGARATLYLVAHRDRGDWSAKRKAHHDSGELAREPKLSDEEVRVLLASGCVELGAHTLTHANLSRLDPDQKRIEIAGSKDALEQRFGVEVASFAYPFGIWDARDRDLVREAGFSSAVTTVQGIDPWPPPDPFALRRVKISGREGFFAFRTRLRTGRRGLWK